MIWFCYPSLLGRCARLRASAFFAWVVAGFLWLAGFAYAAGWSAGLTLLLLVLYAAAMAAFLVDSVRRSRITAPILKAFRKALPSMSQTERDALEAGTVWWEGELFAGNPDWNKMLGYAWPRLSPEEQSFLDIETTELCRLTDDWQSTQSRTFPRRCGSTSRRRASWA